MPYLRGDHNWRAAIIEIGIVDASRYREHKMSLNPILRGVKPYKALIDTGATTTMVTNRVVDELQLPPVNKRLWRNKDGEVWRTAYLFHVIFYGDVVPQGDSEEDGQSLVYNTHVCTRIINGGAIDNELSFDVLMGMDVITTGDLSIRKDGSFGFTFE